MTLDITDQLFTAFTERNPDQQLLVDAAAEIQRLRRELRQQEERHTQLLVPLYQRAYNVHQHARQVADEATTALAVQHAHETARLRADLTAARQRAHLGQIYREAVRHLPLSVRSTRAHAGTRQDTRLLNDTVAAIEQANRDYHREVYAPAKTTKGAA